MKRALAVAAILALVLAVGAPGATQPPVPPIRWVDGIEDPTAGIREGPPSRPDPDSAPAALEDVPAFFGRYPSAAEVRAFLGDLTQEYPHLTALETVGTSWQGRPILGIRLGNEAAGDPDARPALYLDG
ncbi:MAG: M14 family zinc carboxypeptidase, partial [Anaerolineae bacterium]